MTTISGARLLVTGLMTGLNNLKIAIGNIVTARTHIGVPHPIPIKFNTSSAEAFSDSAD